jgi:hypothetical protein
LAANPFWPTGLQKKRLRLRTLVMTTTPRMQSQCETACEQMSLAILCVAETVAFCSINKCEDSVARLHNCAIAAGFPNLLALLESFQRAQTELRYLTNSVKSSRWSKAAPFILPSVHSYMCEDCEDKISVRQGELHCGLCRSREHACNLGVHLFTVPSTRAHRTGFDAALWTLTMRDLSTRDPKDLLRHLTEQWLPLRAVVFPGVDEQVEKSRGGCADYIGFLLPGVQCLRLVTTTINAQTVLSDAVMDTHARCVKLFKDLPEARDGSAELHQLEIDPLETIDIELVKDLAKRIDNLKTSAVFNGVPPPTDSEAKLKYTDACIRLFAEEHVEDLNAPGSLEEALMAAFKRLYNRLPPVDSHIAPEPSFDTNSVGGKEDEAVDEEDEEDQEDEEESALRRPKRLKRASRAFVVLTDDEVGNDDDNDDDRDDTSPRQTHAPTTLLEVIRSQRATSLGEIQALRCPCAEVVLGSRRTVLRSSSSAVQLVMQNLSPNKIAAVGWAVAAISSWVHFSDMKQMIPASLDQRLNTRQLQNSVEACCNAAYDLFDDGFGEESEQLAALALTLHELSLTIEHCGG